MTYLLLPGNPPAVHFYDAWKADILRMRPEARVRVSPYPPAGLGRDSAKVMGRILAAHGISLREFSREAGGPVRVIGHSLGGYFALRLLEEYPSLVEQAVLVHPFLRAPTPRGRLILGALRALSPYGILPRGLARLRARLARFFPDLEYVTDDEVLNTFHLARHEHATIARDGTPIHVPRELRPKVRVFYTPGDSWCTAAVIAALRDQVAIHECDEPHDFVRDGRHRLRLFERIAAS